MSVPDLVKRLRHHPATIVPTFLDLTAADALEQQAARIAELETKSAANEESARFFARNADFYKGIVRQIGSLFGEAARTSDDGSVQDSVLALKVPELVEAQCTRITELEVERNSVIDVTIAQVARIAALTAALEREMRDSHDFDWSPAECEWDGARSYQTVPARAWCIHMGAGYAMCWETEEFDDEAEARALHAEHVADVSGKALGGER